ncbi:MAG TPA: hypothetical protein VES02_15155 [Dermatophilaceae bacterium]|nr:hypothetical protein [Dermatophilaceae bacterium]
MRATISTQMRSDVNRMWTEFLKADFLTSASAAALYFTPKDGHASPTTREVGDTYVLTLSAFRVLPLGRHFIEVKVMDAGAGEICTQSEHPERGRFDHSGFTTAVHQSGFQIIDETSLLGSFGFVAATAV